MILVFPMLTDESVSQNTLPGICKVLEKFILIYEMDAIMKITGWTVLGIGGKIATQMISSKQSKLEAFELLEQGGTLKPGWSSYSQDPDEEDEADDEDDNDSSGGGGRPGKGPGSTLFSIGKGLKDLGTVKAELPKEQALSVEPTYVSLNTTVGTRLIGIKVIPIPIQSKRYNLVQLMMADSKLKFFDSMAYSISRKVIRAFWALCRGLRLPFLKSRVITGDPEKDILWAQSYHKRNVFCLINYADITNANFFKDPAMIHKLHYVGWNSFVAADDVNKRAIFCMKEFHGLCSAVPYDFIYSSLGKEHIKVYDKLEDLKKSASPFFRTKYSEKKIFGESMDNIDLYLDSISKKEE